MPGSAVQVRPQLPNSAPGLHGPGAFILGSFPATLGPWPIRTGTPITRPTSSSSAPARSDCSACSNAAWCGCIVMWSTCSTMPAASAPRSIRKSRSTTSRAFPRIEAAELVVRLKAQAAPFRPVYHLGEQVQALERAERRLLAAHDVEGHGAAGQGGDHRRRRRRLRAQPAAARRHRGVRRQERLLLRDAAREFPRQARGDCRRRRHRGRLGAVAERDRGAACR